ncbi:MAG: type II toxin-antitoxin system RelE/ParE family toxin [Betaproteobacteria bacterium]|nr:type II toxin-antitoxin system RelE/ParE family toxin [Betaproteobacteria bacterium]
MTLHYTLWAEVEYEEALAWYLERDPCAADGLDDVLAEAESLLTRHPGLGAPRSGRVRIFPLKKYPYSLVYYKQATDLVIVAIAHQSRRPGYWRPRLKSLFQP